MADDGCDRSAGEGRLLREWLSTGETPRCTAGSRGLVTSQGSRPFRRVLTGRLPSQRHRRFTTWMGLAFPASPAAAPLFASGEALGSKRLRLPPQIRSQPVHAVHQNTAWHPEV